VKFCRAAEEKGLSAKIHAVSVVSNPPLTITRYPPSFRLSEDDDETPESVLRCVLKFFVMSLHPYHAKLNGPVPWGLAALRDPFWDPDVLQKIKIGSFTEGAEGYEVYLTAFAPGAVS
jgi:hypothetical protein